MPPKTLTPWWICPTLRMSSMITTVLPTPAPPNSAILPPRGNGVSRSIAFRPVSKTSGNVFTRENAICGRRIGHRASAETGPSPSEGSPTQSRTRPFTPGPTGTVIGDWVS